MAREKRSCDYERPICRRVATTRILAAKGRTQHVSQYCAEHFQAVQREVPPGWKIVKAELIQAVTA